MSRARAATSALVACLAGGCPASHGGGHAEPPKTVDDRPVRIQIARAEAKRAGGVTELVWLFETGDRATQLLALRGLGRIGGPAIPVLTAALGDADADLAAAAMAAL